MWDRTHISPDSLAVLCIGSCGIHTDLPHSPGDPDICTHSGGRVGAAGIQTKPESGWKAWRIQWTILYRWKSESMWRTTARGMASLHSPFLLWSQAACLDLSSGRSTCPHRYVWMNGWIEIQQGILYITHFNYIKLIEYSGKLTQHSRGKKGHESVLLTRRALKLQLKSVM